MQTLERRITALEQSNATNFDLVLCIVFDTPGLPDTEIHNLRSLVGVNKTEQRWEREPDELEQEFRARAVLEVKRSEYGTAVLMKVD